MSKKFHDDRSVTSTYAKTPMYYTGILHPSNKNKELVIMDRFGKSYTACWRNNHLCKVGIEFLLKATKQGFIYKDYTQSYGSALCNAGFCIMEKYNGRVRYEHDPVIYNYRPLKYNHKN